MDLNFLNNQTFQIIVALGITLVLVFCFEYIKFYNEARSEIRSLLFLRHKSVIFPFSIYFVIQFFISMFVFFIICYNTKLFYYQFPLNILCISITSSTFSGLGIVNNTQISLYEFELNILKKFIDEFRTNIIEDIKKLETTDVRKIASRLEQSKTIEQLQSGYKTLNTKRFFELEKEYGGYDVESQKAQYAWEIANEDLTDAENLLENRV